MFGLLALTGTTGFLSSFVLLKSGVESMTLRYPVAVALAYGAFLLLLRVWIHAQREEGLEVMDVRTWVPALIVALFLSFAGGLLHHAVPGAHSLGPAWKVMSMGGVPLAADSGSDTLPPLSH
jgi:hypothetical protein